LCTSPLLVRDDNEQVVCTACGARLEVLPTPTETRVRHIGEGLDSVRESLEPEAVERALVRLRERHRAQAQALAGELTTARLRQVMTVIGAVACIAGGTLSLMGAGGFSAFLFFLGMFLMLGGFGMRWGAGWSTVESQQRHRERQAVRTQQALGKEIARRERLLTDLN
jgi:hypothetical protein